MTGVPAGVDQPGRTNRGGQSGMPTVMSVTDRELELIC